MKPAGYTPLDKETALRHVDDVEQMKAKTMANVVLAAQMGRFPKQRIPEAAEMAKVQALDTLFKKEGVDSDDIVIAFNMHSLQESEEFKQIMMRAQQKVKSEMEAQMQQIQAAQQAQQQA